MCLFKCAKINMSVYVCEFCFKERSKEERKYNNKTMVFDYVTAADDDVDDEIIIIWLLTLSLTIK